MNITGFKNILKGPFARYLKLSQRIGNGICVHSIFVREAFLSQLKYLAFADQSKKSSLTEQNILLETMSQCICAVEKYKTDTSVSAYPDHLLLIAESISILKWVLEAPVSISFMTEMIDMAVCYSDMISKNWKDKDRMHVDWSQAWILTLYALLMYVKTYHYDETINEECTSQNIMVKYPSIFSTSLEDNAALHFLNLDENVDAIVSSNAVVQPGPSTSKIYNFINLTPTKIESAKVTESDKENFPPLNSFLELSTTASESDNDECSSFTSVDLSDNMEMQSDPSLQNTSPTTSKLNTGSLKKLKERASSSTTVSLKSTSAASPIIKSKIRVYFNKKRRRHYSFLNKNTPSHILESNINYSSLHHNEDEINVKDICNGECTNPDPFKKYEFMSRYWD